MATILGKRALQTARRYTTGIPPPPPSSSASNGKTPEQPKEFVPPVAPAPESRNLNLLARFQQKLMRDAENIEHMRKNPEEPKSNFIYRYDAKLDARIKEMEAAQLKRKEEGLSTKMGPVAQKFRSGVLSSVLDSDKNEEERLELMEGFKKGNFDDIKELSKKGLKLWTAPMKLSAPSSSPLMVNIEGKSLLGVKTDIHTLIKHKEVSLVTFVFTALGEPHVKSYMTPFLEAFPEGNVIQMNIEEEWTKSWALALFEPFIRFKVPEKQRAQYLIKRGSVLKERTKIKMDNRLLGWVHLVDREGRVRWTAHGPAKDEEIQALIANTKLLMA